MQGPAGTSGWQFWSRPGRAAQRMCATTAGASLGWALSPSAGLGSGHLHNPKQGQIPGDAGHLLAGGVSRRCRPRSRSKRPLPQGPRSPIPWWRGWRDGGPLPKVPALLAAISLHAARGSGEESRYHLMHPA
ncbi:hypothetical protein GGTG_02026 [Gaeumannomyces tritici R3-111a-1]|uniref:Uncharacterized protein n=1 Tax=Gaeumannomyces tritici (strain R3-111a-1) TaxID=644352 RepID=J3NL84_GAET3|nr:hypothetical protein GGTG_02026 [Gaeumannomyces tritici R3-111a-1]EJT82052.1 hypothetical protein GGTG_02026 [Gaeumannomyces tritici R3-111a-1]